MADKYHRRVIKITAEDSPNVIYAKEEIAAGFRPSNTIVVPGVLSYALYRKRRKLWDEERQCVGLDACLWKGESVMLFPEKWLTLSENRADELTELQLKGMKRKAEAIGIDPAEGGDDTTFSVIDRLGLLEQHSMKTRDTTQVTSFTKNLIRRTQVPADMVMLDLGGGGQEHADRLRSEGYNVRTVGFGEGAQPQVRGRYYKKRSVIIEEAETRYSYKNRRSQMYGMVSIMLDPSSNEFVFALPRRFKELRRQLSLMPKLYDQEGRLYLPSKNKKSAKGTEKSLRQILGCSPDEADSLVIAIYCLITKTTRRKIGAI